MDFMHGKGICHRDMKPDNVLVDEKYNIRIADFGFAKDVPHDKFMETRVGTLNYMSPEILMGQKYDGVQADLFAIGVILFVMYGGSFPF